MNSSFIRDISDVSSKFTKFPLGIITAGGDKAFNCISRDHMINEPLDSVGEIPSP